MTGRADEESEPAMYSRSEELAVAAADAGISVTGILRDAHRDVLLAVRQGLAARHEQEEPRIGIFEVNGITTVYISMVSYLDDPTRTEVCKAVQGALSPYTMSASFTNFVFLIREARRPGGQPSGQEQDQEQEQEQDQEHDQDQDEKQDEKEVRYA